jgi:hypothetical protein
MSRRSRVLSAIAGLVMVVSGLLVLAGYRGGWLFGAAGAAAGAFVVCDSVLTGRRSD